MVYFYCRVCLRPKVPPTDTPDVHHLEITRLEERWWAGAGAAESSASPLHPLEVLESLDDIKRHTK